MTVIIPTLLGMMTTLLILSIVIGPPTTVFSTPIPPDLIVESWEVTQSGRDRIVTLYVYNPGDQGLYILSIYANNKQVVFKHIYVPPHSQIKQVQFILPRFKRVSRVNVSILWRPEQGTANHRIDIPITLPKK
jgi:hypothetical protein